MEGKIKLIFFLSIFSFMLNAQTTYNWLGGNGNWNTGSKWTPTGVPGVADTAIINSGTIILNSNNEVATYIMHGGELKGNGTLSVSYLMQWTGGLMSGGGTTQILSSASLEIFGTDLKEINRKTLNNGGSAAWYDSGTIGTSVAGKIVNQANATFDIQNNANIDDLDLAGGSLDNYGHITKSSGGVSNINVIFNNLNQVEVQSGTLNLNQTGTDEGTYDVAGSAFLNFFGVSRTLTPASILTGTGTISFSGDSLINNSNINPGTSPGIINFDGNLPLDESATVNIEIGGYTAGTDYDRVEISDSVLFNGSLSANLINGFMPVLGDTFRVMTYSNHQDQFNYISSVNFGNGLVLGANYTANGLVLIADYKPIAVDDYVVTDEDIEITFDVLTNDSDPGNDSLFIFSFTQPANGSITQVSGSQLSFIPDSNFYGLDSIIYVISDTKSGLDTAMVHLEVVSVNDVPVITSTPDPSAVQDQPYSYQVVAIDPDINDSLTYSFNIAPGFLSIDPVTGLVSGTPTSVDTGMHSVEIRVVDSYSAADTQQYQLYVSAVNYPPVISPLPPLNFDEDDTLVVQISDWYPYVDDPNDPDNTLSYIVVSGTNVQAVAGNLIYYFYAAANWYGLDTLQLIVSDGLLSDTSALYISVLSVNDLPNIVSTPDPTAVQDQLYSYQVIADDPDIGDILTYSFLSAPGFLTIDSLSGLISGTPTNADTGMHSVSFKVEDSFSAADTQNYILTVADVNYPPILSPVPTLIFAEDDTLVHPTSSWYSYVTDPDDPVQNLIYVVEGGTNVTVSGGGTTFNFSAPQNWFGLDTMRLIVADGFSADTTDLFLQVQSVNDVPLVNLPDVISFRTDSTATLSLWNYMSDVETPDSLLILQFSSTNDSLLYNYETTTGMIAFSAQPGFWGDVYFNVSVTDDSGALTEDTILVRVTGIIDNIVDFIDQIPTTYDISQNYPNPFNPTTKINFDIPQPGKVSIFIYNILGQKVATLMNENVKAGTHIVEFDATNLPSGIYLYQIQAGNFQQVKKMTLLK